MIDTLITSKTRIKLLLRFFLNSNSRSYLRALESEFGESSNSIRVELNRFEEAGLLVSETESNKKYFQANNEHPLFSDIRNILFKYVGFDQIIVEVIQRIGKLKKVYVVGDFAKGLDSKIIDLLFIGDQMDNNYIVKLLGKAERLIKRKIRFLIVKMDECQEYLNNYNETERLLLWQAESEG
jgi:hypothetical protein